jgi:hypothetical protein
MKFVGDNMLRGALWGSILAAILIPTVLPKVWHPEEYYPHGQKPTAAGTRFEKQIAIWGPIVGAATGAAIEGGVWLIRRRKQLSRQLAH